MQRADDIDIESWARERDFAELTEAEQALAVATLGSSDAYRRLRATLLAAREALTHDAASAEPDPAIARDLHAALSARAAGRLARAGAHGARERDAAMSARRRGIASALVALFEARIPAWQAALGAAALVAIALLALPSPQAPAPIVERQIVHVPVRDTIVVTRTDARDEARDETLIAAARPEGSLRATRRVDAPRRATRPAATDRRRDDIAERRVTPRRAPKDSAIAKPDVERPNSFVGLDNVRLLAQQRRGVTIAEDTSYRAFTFAVN